MHADQEKGRLKTPLSFHIPHIKPFHFCCSVITQYLPSLYRYTVFALLHFLLSLQNFHNPISIMSANSEISPDERESDRSMTPETIACNESALIHQQRTDEASTVKKVKSSKRSKSSASSSQPKSKKHKKKKSSHSSGLIKEKKSKKKKSGKKHETNRSFSMTDLYLTPNPFNPDDSSNVDKSGESLWLSLMLMLVLI